MNRNSELFVAALICLSVSVPSFGSQVHCKPLQEVLPMAKLVFVAAVEKAELVPGDTSTRINLTLMPKESLVGALPKGGKIECFYSQVVPVKRDKTGKVILSFSPIINGSGQEFTVKPRQEWIVLIAVKRILADGPTPILRIEKIESKDLILDLLGRKQKVDR